MLGVQHPIMSAPLGPDISGPLLVAAVSNSGGLGLLRAPDQDNPKAVQALIRSTRDLTKYPFGIGITLTFPHEGNLTAALLERVHVLHVSLGAISKEIVDRAHNAGVRVVQQVGSVEAAIGAAEAGVDAIIAQSMEAGGHIEGKLTMWELLPSVVAAVRKYNVAVIAAGGIVNARGYVAALTLGADGVCLGTRFVATVEAFAHPLYKTRLVQASYFSTQITNMYGRARWNARHRVLRTPFHDHWKGRIQDDTTELNQPTVGFMTIDGEEEMVPRFSWMAPNLTSRGDISSMCMYAGTGVGQIKGVTTAAEVIQALVENGQEILNHELKMMELKAYIRALSLAPTQRMALCRECMGSLSECMCMGTRRESMVAPRVLMSPIQFMPTFPRRGKSKGPSEFTTSSVLPRIECLGSPIETMAECMVPPRSVCPPSVRVLASSLSSYAGAPRGR